MAVIDYLHYYAATACSLWSLLHVAAWAAYGPAVVYATCSLVFFLLPVMQGSKLLTQTQRADVFSFVCLVATVYVISLSGFDRGDLPFIVLIPILSLFNGAHALVWACIGFLLTVFFSLTSSDGTLLSQMSPFFFPQASLTQTVGFRTTLLFLRMTAILVVVFAGRQRKYC